jgi:hypothetical protein
VLSGRPRAGQDAVCPENVLEVWPLSPQSQHGALHRQMCRHDGNPHLHAPRMRIGRRADGRSPGSRLRRWASPSRRKRAASVAMRSAHRLQLRGQPRLPAHADRVPYCPAALRGRAGTISGPMIAGGRGACQSGGRGQASAPGVCGWRASQPTGTRRRPLIPPAAKAAPACRRTAASQPSRRRKPASDPAGSRTAPSAGESPCQSA